MEKKVKILLVEDELIIADYMQECLNNYGYEVIDVCINYNEALTALANNTPDIVLLDITLKGDRNGIDLGNYINTKIQLPFVYITSHSDKATIDKAKQTLPYAYLIKPFDENDLYAAIETALMHFARRKEAAGEKEEGEKPVIIKDGIFVKHKGKFVKIQLNELFWLEANDNYVTLNTKAGQYVLKTTLKMLQDALPEYFVRTHRSYVINLHHIKSFDNEELVIDNKTLPVGKSHFADLLEKLKILQG